MFVPPWESPDEPAHYQYAVNFFSKFPGIKRPHPPSNSLLDKLTIAYENHQPPIYYFLAALPTALSGNKHRFALTPNPDFPDPPNRFTHTGSIFIPLYMTRSISVILFIFTLYIIHKTCFHLIEEKECASIYGVVFVGFIPQVLLVFSTVNNDTLGIFWSALYMHQVARRVLETRNTASNSIRLGILAGLGLLTKLNLFFLLPATVVLFIVEGISGDHKTIARNILWFIVVTTLISGWWYLLGWQQCGDPTGIEYQKQLFQKPGAYLRADTVPFFLRMTVISFFGMFGWMNLPIPVAFIWFYIALISAGLWAAWKAPFSSLFVNNNNSRNYRLLVCFSIVGLVILLAGFVRFNTHIMQPQGRLLFPGLPYLAVIMGASFSWYTRGRNPKTWLLILILVQLLFSILSLYYGAIAPYN